MQFAQRESLMGEGPTDPFNLPHLALIFVHFSPELG